MDQNQARRIVYDAIDVVNQQLPASKRLQKTPDTVIVGAAGVLDSLGIVNFVMTLEDKAGDVLGTPIQLFDETTLIQEDGPFRTVGGLTHYLATMPGV
jgi:acyl carrier protein